MNWFKDNLIAILGVACVCLLITALVTQVQYQRQKATFAAQTAELADIKRTNTANVDKLDAALAENNRLIRERSLEIQKAEDAAERARLAALATEAERANAAALRAELSAKNALIKTYLAGGMPRDLACLRWPEQCR